MATNKTVTSQNHPIRLLRKRQNLVIQLFSEFWPCSTLPHKCTWQWIPWLWCVDVSDFCSVPLRHFVWDSWTPALSWDLEYEQRLLTICPALSRRTALTFCSGKQPGLGRKMCWGCLLLFHIIDAFFKWTQHLHFCNAWWRFCIWELKYWHFGMTSFNYLEDFLVAFCAFPLNLVVIHPGKHVIVGWLHQTFLIFSKQ